MIGGSRSHYASRRAQRIAEADPGLYIGLMCGRVLMSQNAKTAP
jgi:hypothetical protein